MNKNIFCSGKGMLDCGTLPELYNTIDFGGGNITAHFDLQAQYNSGGPPVNTEFYPGWLSHWGHKFPSKSRTATASESSLFSRIFRLKCLKLNEHVFSNKITYGILSVRQAR